MAGAPGHSEWRDVATAWTAVGEFSSAVAVYGVGGWFADKYLHTGHVLFLLGLLLGMVLGVYLLVKRGDQAAGGRPTPRSTPRAPH
jgi:F0F1-type ATP synthase assembly protein I